MNRQGTRAGRAAALGILAAGAAVLTLAKVDATASASGVSETAPVAAPVLRSDAKSLAATINAAMGLRDGGLVHIDVDTAPRVARQIIVGVDDRVLTLDLEPHSVRADDFRVFISGADGTLTEVEPAPESTYRGTVVGDPGSLVGASIDDEGLTGQIVLGDEQRFWIEPVVPRLGAWFGAPLDDAAAAALAGLHVVYRAEDVLDTGQSCGTETPNFAAAAASVAEGRVSAGQTGGDITVEIAFDADSFYVSEYGEAGAQTQITNIVNSGLNVQYPRDVQITYEITAFVLRLERVYFADTIFDLLDDFADRWNTEHGDIIRDVAELFTGLNLSGSVVGLATLGSICEDNGFNVVENFGNFAQMADLSAHELGHNWNALHCDCPNHTMNPSITGSRVFHPTLTIPRILAFKDSLTCARPTNDQCETPDLVADGATLFDTVSATTDGGTTGCGVITKDLWYEYTASCTGELSVSTCGADFDTRIAAYAADDCGGAVIACDDDTCGEASVMVFPVQAGERYLIRVGGRNAVGTGTLMLVCEDEPCPDIDGSGSVDFGDILAILAAWGMEGGPADVDGSGTVAFGDVLVILAAWGPCP